MNIVKYFSAFPRYAVTRQSHKSLKYFSKVVPCSKCSTELASNVLICPECNTLQLLDEKSCNYFTLYGLPETFDIENSAIDSSFKALQRILHPDKFVAGDEGVKNISNKNSSIVNKANDTLKYPLKRAVYLLSLHNVFPFKEENIVQYPALMVEIFDIREEISESEDNSHLDEIASDVNSRIAILEKELRVCFVEKDWTAAKTLVVKWKYLLKILEEIVARKEELSQN